MPRTNKRNTAAATPTKRVMMKDVVTYIRQLENRILFLQSKVTTLDDQRRIHHDCLNMLHARVKKNAQGVEENTRECMELQVSHAKDAWDTTTFNAEPDWEAIFNCEAYEFLT